MLDLQRSVGNRTTARLLRQPKLDVKGAAKTLGLETDKPPINEVDGFLDSRTSLFKVRLAGTNINVSIEREKEWTGRYTEDALVVAATTAAIRTIYGRRVPAADVARARQTLISAGAVKHTPAREKMTGLEAVSLTVIDADAFEKLSDALGLTAKDMQNPWRYQRGLAAMVSFALSSALRSFDTLEPLFDKDLLERAGVDGRFVKVMLEQRFETLVQVAMTDPAAWPWRHAFAANKELTSGERSVPKLEDFHHATLEEWANAVLRITLAARKTLGRQFKADLIRNRRNYLNEYLRPHEIKVTGDPAEFIAKTFDGEHSERLEPDYWVVKGGMHLTDGRNQKIYLLRVNSEKVIFQNEADGKYYEQSLEGFGQELLYGIYSMAGQQSLDAIKISQWVIGLAGAIWMPVRIVMIASDVINAAEQIEAHKKELEANYREFTIAYENIDALVPGVLSKIWHAVLSKEFVTLLNPLEHVNVAAWFKALLRLAVHWYGFVVIHRTYAAEAVEGLLGKLLKAARIGLTVLVEIVIHVIVLGPAVAGSTGVHGSLEDAAKRLRDIHVDDANEVVSQLAKLTAEDRERLVREIDELQSHARKLADVVHKCLEW